MPLHRFHDILFDTNFLQVIYLVLDVLLLSVSSGEVCVIKHAVNVHLATFSSVIDKGHRVYLLLL